MSWSWRRGGSSQPDLAQLYRSLATDLTRGSCVIITCRYLPEGTPTDLPTVLHLPLPDLDEPNFRKFLRRDEEVDRRISRGELPPTLIHNLYQKLGGTPGFLENVRRVLRTADPDALIEDLEGISPGKLSEARESYYQRIIATRLYEALSIAARGMVSRLAISELPLPIDGVMRIARGRRNPGRIEPGGRLRLRAAPAVRRARPALALSPTGTAPPLAVRPGSPPRTRGFLRPPAPRRVLAIELRGRSRGRAPGPGRGRAPGMPSPRRARRRPTTFQWATIRLAYLSAVEWSARVTRAPMRSVLWHWPAGLWNAGSRAGHLVATGRARSGGTTCLMARVGASERRSSRR